MLAAGMAGGCAGPLSALDPAGPMAGAIGTLWWVMLAGGGAILALVLLLLALGFRRQASASPRLWAVGGGIVFPTAVLAALLVFGIIVGERVLPHPQEDVLLISAEASQWQWRFRYPGGGETKDILHIPTGQPVDIDLTTADVIHSFWVPRLAGKLDAVPGRTNRLRLEAAAPGAYAGICAEYCGTGHARHALRVVAHDADGWRTFQNERQP